MFPATQSLSFTNPHLAIERGMPHLEVDPHLCRIGRSVEGMTLAGLGPLNVACSVARRSVFDCLAHHAEAQREAVDGWGRSGRSIAVNQARAIADGFFADGLSGSPLSDREGMVRTAISRAVNTFLDPVLRSTGSRSVMLTFAARRSLKVLADEVEAARDLELAAESEEAEARAAAFNGRVAPKVTDERQSETEAARTFHRELSRLLDQATAGGDRVSSSPRIVYPEGGA